MHYLFKKIYSERSNLFSILSTSIISIGGSFVLLLAFANLIEKDDLGQYQYIIALSSTIGTASLVGMNAAIIRAVSKQHYSFIPFISRHFLVSSLLPLSVAFLTCGYYYVNHNFVLAFGVLGSTSVFLLLTLLLRYNAIYVALEKFNKSNYLLKAKALAPALVLVPALFWVNNPALLAILYFLSSALGILLILYLLQFPQEIKRLINSHKSDETEKLINHENLKFSIHQSIITLAGAGAAHLDKIIIFQLLGAPATAAYYIATSFSDRLRDIVKQFEPYLFSKFAKYSHDSSRSNLNIKFFVVIIFAIPFTAMYLIFLPIFFKLFIPQYIETLTLSMIYGFTLFASAAVIPHSHLKAHGSNKIFYLYTCLQAAIKLCFLIGGIMLGGLTGAVIGVTISTLLNTALILFFTLFTSSTNSQHIEI